MEYYLKPIYDSRKSFYCKATVRTEAKEKMLFSYNYFIGSVFDNSDLFLFNDNFLNSDNLQTQTTLRHIKEFLRQNNVKKIGVLAENYNSVDVTFDFKKSDLRRLIDANL